MRVPASSSVQTAVEGELGDPDKQRGARQPLPKTPNSARARWRGRCSRCKDSCREAAGSLLAGFARAHRARAKAAPCKSRRKIGPGPPPPTLCMLRGPFCKERQHAGSSPRDLSASPRPSPVQTRPGSACAGRSRRSKGAARPPAAASPRASPPSGLAGRERARGPAPAMLVPGPSEAGARAHARGWHRSQSPARKGAAHCKLQASQASERGRQEDGGVLSTGSGLYSRVSRPGLQRELLCCAISQAAGWRSSPPSAPERFCKRTPKHA